MGKSGKDGKAGKAGKPKAAGGARRLGETLEVSNAKRAAVAAFVDVDDAEGFGLSVANDSGAQVGSVEEFEDLCKIPRGRGAKILEALALVAAGNRWKTVMERTGMSYSELSCRCHSNGTYRAVFKHVLSRQKEALAAKAHDALSDLVENGERIPVVANGKVIDERWTRPVKAIELAMRGDPHEAAAGGQGGGGGVTFQIVMPGRDPVNAEVVVPEDGR